MVERWIGVVGAAVFIAAGAGGLTRTQRRRSAALGAPTWTPTALIAVGVAYALGAWIGSFIPTLLAVLVLLATNSIMRQPQRGREVPPSTSSTDLSSGADGGAATAIHSVRTGGDLGAAIAEARIAQGLSQAALADLGGVSPTYVSTPLLDHQFRLLRRLGATITVEFPSTQAGSPDG